MQGTSILREMRVAHLAGICSVVAQEIGIAALVIPVMFDHRTSYKAGPILAELFGKQIPLAGTKKGHQLAALQDTCSNQLSLGRYRTIARECLVQEDFSCVRQSCTYTWTY